MGKSPFFMGKRWKITIFLGVNQLFLWPSIPVRIAEGIQRVYIQSLDQHPKVFANPGIESFVSLVRFT